MRILDRQRYWSFFKAYVICYVSLVGLYIVIDAFSNLDEFTKRADGTVELFQVMGRYYLVHQSLFFDQLCGVIGMMAADLHRHLDAAEQRAACHAGRGDQHASRHPSGAGLVGDRQLFCRGEPGADHAAVRRRAGESRTMTTAQRTVHVSGRYDARKVLIHGVDADRATKTIFPFYATIPWRSSARSRT